MLQDEVSDLKKELANLRTQSALSLSILQLANVQTMKDVNVLAVEIPNADVDTLRSWPINSARNIQKREQQSS